ncbi:MAG: hypothetical protein EHM77_08130 [Planctomycetaceae bacterium]|nr:MAG: hypothetical protein EHM77_08130 [Planctomycetaceae bacterium]
MRKSRSADRIWSDRFRTQISIGTPPSFAGSLAKGGRQSAYQNPPIGRSSGFIDSFGLAATSPPCPDPDLTTP